MKTTRQKLKIYWGYFAVGIGFLVCGALIASKVENALTEQDVVRIDGQVSFVKYVKGRNRSDAYLSVKIKEYPLYWFDVESGQVVDLLQLNKSIFPGDANRPGDSIAFTIHAEEAQRIKEVTVSSYDLERNVSILGFSLRGIDYLKFDINKYNANGNSSRKSGSYFWAGCGLFFILVGSYRWKKNKKW